MIPFDSLPESVQGTLLNNERYISELETEVERLRLELDGCEQEKALEEAGRLELEARANEGGSMT